jgi:endonuclease/exonuclease/phosphatase family metal-dependent hydrolase
MKMAIKLIFVCVLCLTVSGILYFAGVLIFATITEFKPEASETIPLKKENSSILPVMEELNFLTWNIGYGGLGKESDFFYEGGKMVRPDQPLSEKYIHGIADFISSNDSNDFILLQEVDFHSKRSYFLDQAEFLDKVTDGFSMSKAVNYKSPYVPVPYLNPLGKVNSGIVTMTKYNPVESVRISTPGSYSWPKRLFMLKRCLLVSKFNVENGKSLVVYNIHNSAFDDADALRDEELNLIRKQATQEYQNGNYVIIGGDWNQNPPGLAMNSAVPYKVKALRPIPADLMPDDWKWAFDSSLPTNRDVDKPFDKDSTLCQLIDFFLVSPNIDLIQIRTIDLEFENSDHLPVMMKIELKEE